MCGMRAFGVGRIEIRMTKIVRVSDPEGRVINNAYGRILQHHNEREFLARKQRPDGGVLYHYTTADGLKGIVENEELWSRLPII